MPISFVVNEVEIDNASVWSCSSVQRLVGVFCNLLLGHKDRWYPARENQSSKQMFPLPMQKDVFTVTIQIEASHTPDMKNATTHLKSASCRYGLWSPRELICESNYMEVSTYGTVLKVRG